MAIRTADLIASIRRRANVERTRFVTDDEILGWINDALDDLWDLVREVNAGHFSQQVAFELSNGSNAITLQEATTGVVPFTNPGSGSGTVTPSVHNAVYGLSLTSTFPDGYSRYVVKNLTIQGAGTPPVNLGDPCTFTLAVNGVATDISIVVPTGLTAPFFSDRQIEVALQDKPTLIADVSTGLGGTWQFTASFDGEGVMPESDFLAEVAICWTPGGKIREIPKLNSLSDRGKVCEPHFWIAGDVLSFYPFDNPPQGTIYLDYVPRAPVLANGDPLPEELERFRSFIEFGVCAEIKSKRAMLDEATSFLAKQNAQREQIRLGLNKRVAGARQIPMKDKDRLHRLYPGHDPWRI